MDRHYRQETPEPKTNVKQRRSRRNKKKKKVPVHWTIAKEKAAKAIKAAKAVKAAEALKRKSKPSPRTVRARRRHKRQKKTQEQLLPEEKGPSNKMTQRGVAGGGTSIELSIEEGEEDIIINKDDRKHTNKRLPPLAADFYQLAKELGTDGVSRVVVAGGTPQGQFKVSVLRGFLNRTLVGTFLERHLDSSNYSMSLHFRDAATEGGNLQLWRAEYNTNSAKNYVKGDVIWKDGADGLIFPGHLFQHRTMPVTNGIDYAIIVFFGITFLHTSGRSSRTRLDQELRLDLLPSQQRKVPATIAALHEIPEPVWRVSHSDGVDKDLQIREVEERAKRPRDASNRTSNGGRKGQKQKTDQLIDGKEETEGEIGSSC